MARNNPFYLNGVPKSSTSGGWMRVNDSITSEEPASSAYEQLSNYVAIHRKQAAMASRA